MTGKVYLVGAGPGAPDLITVRAEAILARADIVLFDALVHPEVVALASRAQHVAVGKRCGSHATAQHFINKRLVDAAHQFETVVRLKGGDSGLFARSHEEITALRAAGVEFEIVPGVSAAFAATAALGATLTQRGVARSVVFATPRVGAAQGATDWSAAVLAADTAALYMAGAQVRDVARELIARGRPASTPAALVESATLPEERVHALTLGELAESPPSLGAGPAIVLLGEVYGQLELASASEAPGARRLGNARSPRAQSRVRAGR